MYADCVHLYCMMCMPADYVHLHNVCRKPRDFDMHVYYLSGVYWLIVQCMKSYV